MAEVFLDTGFAIALACPRDQHHQHAEKLAVDLQSQKTRIVTTRGVMLEIGNALSKRQYRHAAIRLLDALDADPSVEIVALDDELYRRSYDLFQNRLDKDWSLTDCMSFVVMKDRGIVEALTPDDHFSQAGYQALLRG